MGRMGLGNRFYGAFAAAIVVGGCMGVPGLFLLVFVPPFVSALLSPALDAVRPDRSSSAFTGISLSLSIAQNGGGYREQGFMQWFDWLGSYSIIELY